MQPLTGKQKRHLRGLAHHLKPLVQIGADGASDGVLQHIDEALEAHELVKVRLLDADRDDLAEALSRVEAQVKAHIVQTVGHTLVLFRQRTDPDRPTAYRLPRSKSRS